MNCTFDQITNIVVNNPNKNRILLAKQMANKLRLHMYGVGMDSALVQCKYFENTDVYSVRKEYAVSNKDLFTRLLQQEDMVYSAKGGSSYFNLPESEERQMNVLLDEVRYGMSLRKWVKNFALEAYRSDPGSIIFIESDQIDPANPVPPKAYPTYKSIYSIYDYDTTGRKLEYVCFQLAAWEVFQYGINDPELKDVNKDTQTEYFRFVDDGKDMIVKRLDGRILPVGNTIQNVWGRTPGFIVSDIMKYDDPKTFLSPLDSIIELADSFLTDRSIRDLQKRYHGFSKAVEPLLTCVTCDGEGLLNGECCPTCQPHPNAVRGTGYNMRTKVSDVARFPMELFEKGGFDFRRIYGYVTPDIEGWNKQDESVEKLEGLMYMTYWGTVQPQQVSGPRQTSGQDNKETATKTEDNKQPRYARLNRTAEWSEKTEMLIADFIGRYWFEQSFKKSAVAYGRYYILETPDELMNKYQKMRSDGAPEASLYEALEKYYHSVYQNSPVELAIRLKLLYVEPFPHLKVTEAKNVISEPNDFNAKLYFGEWYSSMEDIEFVLLNTDQLRAKLKEFVTKKNIPNPQPQTVLN